MMRWYEITAPSPDALRNIQKDLKKQHLMVRQRDSHLYTCLSTAHQTFLPKIVADFGGQVRALEAPPPGERIPKLDEYVMPCGEKVYDPLLVGLHQRWCKKCQEVAPSEHRDVSGRRSRIVAHIEPGQPFTIDGVIASLEATKDQLFTKVDLLDKLVTNLKAWRDGREGLAKLEREVEQRLTAAKMIIPQLK